MHYTVDRAFRKDTLDAIASVHADDDRIDGELICTGHDRIRGTPAQVNGLDGKSGIDRELSGTGENGIACVVDSQCRFMTVADVSERDPTRVRASESDRERDDAVSVGRIVGCNQEMSNGARHHYRLSGLQVNPCPS